MSRFMTAIVLLVSGSADINVLAKPVSSDPGIVIPKGPVIGILDQNYGEDMAEDMTRGKMVHKTYIAASYVKHLEGAGARVVPLFYQDSLEELTEKFGMINGLLFPGGGMDLRDFSSPYMESVLHLWGLALKANQNGDYFPVWGTCLGFETISVAAAQNGSVLQSGFDSEDLPLPLNMTSAASSSKLIGTAPSQIVEWMETTNSTMNNHQSGVTPAMFTSNSNLSAFYNVLSTSTDRQGRIFASTIEGKNAPVWGTQWHPEKAIFEWTDREAIPHTLAAVSIAQYVANFFVAAARKSTHSYNYTTLTKDIIWNYTPIYSFDEGSNFDQEYIWPQSKQQ